MRKNFLGRHDNLNLNTNNFTLVCNQTKSPSSSVFSIKTRNYFAPLEDKVWEKETIIIKNSRVRRLTNAFVAENIKKRRGILNTSGKIDIIMKEFDALVTT